MGNSGAFPEKIRMCDDRFTDENNKRTELFFQTVDRPVTTR